MLKIGNIAEGTLRELYARSPARRLRREFVEGRAVRTLPRL